MLNKYIFSLDLKIARNELDRLSTGREFHGAG